MNSPLADKFNVMISCFARLKFSFMSSKIVSYLLLVVGMLDGWERRGKAFWLRRGQSDSAEIFF